MAKPRTYANPGDIGFAVAITRTVGKDSPREITSYWWGPSWAVRWGALEMGTALFAFAPRGAPSVERFDGAWRPGMSVRRVSDVEKEYIERGLEWDAHYGAWRLPVAEESK